MKYMKNRVVVYLNLYNLSYRNQFKFIQMYQNARSNGEFNTIDFVKVWNKHAKNINEHVFYHVKS